MAEHTGDAVILVYWGRRGGGARYTYEIARSLRHVVDGPVIVSLNADDELLDEFRAMSSPPAFEVDVRRFGRRGRAWLSLLPGPWSFGSWCRQRHGRVVITMGNPLSVLLAVVLRTARVPFVHVVHDARRHEGERSQLMHLSVRWATRLADGAVALSENVRRQVVDDWHVPAERTSVVPHGPFYASEADAVRRDRQLDGGPPTPPYWVVFLGRIMPYKGLGLLLDAWLSLPSPVPAVLVVAGEGDLGPYAERLHRIEAAGAGMGGVEVRNAWLSDAEIVEIMSGADLLVLPYTEASQSGVIGIAHSFGVPVLATDVGGLAEQAHLDDGDRVVPADATSLAAGLSAFFAGPTRGSTGSVDDPWAPIASRLVEQLAAASVRGRVRHRVGRRTSG